MVGRCESPPLVASYSPPLRSPPGILPTSLLDQLFRVRATPVGQVTGDPALLRGTTVVVMGGTRGIGAAQPS